eukprot:11222083-Lingulodinium_polyedra.AAC.1
MNKHMFRQRLRTRQRRGVQPLSQRRARASHTGPCHTGGSRHLDEQALLAAVLPWIQRAVHLAHVAEAVIEELHVG